MAYGRPVNVRSHRRGRPKRKPTKVAPWIIVTAVLVVVVGSLSAGYIYLIRPRCSGSAQATVFASPAMATILDQLGRDWAGGEPVVNGKCASVDIESKDSAATAAALGSNPWDPKVNGTAPDVWVPESTVWLRLAANDPDAAKIIPQLQPSLARTPVVMAMPKDMATALGWPKTTLTWSSFVTAANWNSLGKPWGPFRLGASDPAKSTAGLLALVAMLDKDHDGTISSAEQADVSKIKQRLSEYQDSTAHILADLGKQDGQGRDAALGFVSAFPALEQDLISYNMASPKEPLVAVYPTDGSADADHPYLVLNASWSTPERKQVAEAFLRYAQSAPARKALSKAGFRDPDRAGGDGLTSQSGFAAQLPTPPRAAPTPAAAAMVLSVWAATVGPPNG